MKVSGLIDQDSRQWKLEVVSSFISSEERDAISVVPIPSEKKPDKVVWPMVDKGEYSVKSGYHVCHEENSDPDDQQGTSHCILVKDWKLVWNISASPKVVSFIWRAFSNILPVMSNLRQKRAVQYDKCPICHCHEETIEHCLLLCDWAQMVWFGSDVHYRVDRQQIRSFEEWFVGTVEGAKLRKRERAEFITMLAYSCWMIWKCRCEFVHGGSKIDVERTIQGIRFLVSEWTSNQGNEMVIKASKEKDVGWKKPEEDFVKINYDASLKLPCFSAGIGVIVRDEEARMIDGANFIINASSVLAAEASALKCGVKLAVEKDYRNVTFEMDSRIFLISVRMIQGAPGLSLQLLRRFIASRLLFLLGVGLWSQEMRMEQLIG